MSLSFERWFLEQGRKPAPATEPELPDGLWRGGDGKVYFACRVCEEPTELYWSLSEGFDKDMAYCGGSPRCCP